MRRPASFSLLGLTAAVLSLGNLTAGDWTQFRGPKTGRATADAKLPAEIGPDEHVLWKVETPAGHSSPVIFGDRIFLTGIRDKTLVTFALDRNTGKPLWEQVAPHETLEEVHSTGNHAQSSPATDGERVVSFFGSSGLSCYDMDGKLQWQHRMGPFKNDFGAGSSPLIVDDRVILVQDHDVGSFLAAWDKKSGKLLWRTDRPDFFRNYCTPTVITVDGKKQIVIAATLRVVAYDFETGKELWTVPGLSRVVCTTPAVGDDGVLYVCGWSAGGGDEGSRIEFDPFDVAIEKLDKDKNGTFEEDELPKGDLKQRFTQADYDKDTHITKKEYETFRVLFQNSKNAVMAVKPVSGTSTVPEAKVMWRHEKNVPFCASPLFADGNLFLVKDGGILTALDAKSGKPQKVARLPATGEYYSSPVAGDGKAYFVNDEGQLSVISTEGKWEVLHSAEFKEDVHATPAIVDGKIYLRTGSRLYCFGL
ncbi:MAG: PQQ-binding-like beta-propeller repeat protein [Planctomycetaceae bacterium]|nr:PQQ-binding-like beta-propeller repeat protein [Planctomycetaceae bacterium]